VRAIADGAGSGALTLPHAAARTRASMRSRALSRPRARLRRRSATPTTADARAWAPADRVGGARRPRSTSRCACHAAQRADRRRVRSRPVGDDVAALFAGFADVEWCSSRPAQLDWSQLPQRRPAARAGLEPPRALRRRARLASRPAPGAVEPVPGARHRRAGVVTWGYADGALDALRAWLEGRGAAPGRSPVLLTSLITEADHDHRHAAEPLADPWVPTLYFAEGLPLVGGAARRRPDVQEHGIGNDQISRWTGIIGFAWVFKPLWSPFLEALGTNRSQVVLFQFIGGASLTCSARR
jgi:hypothetical protein